jgi:hypothetical protein
MTINLEGGSRDAPDPQMVNVGSAVLHGSGLDSICSDIKIDVEIWCIAPSVKAKRELA